MSHKAHMSEPSDLKYFLHMKGYSSLNNFRNVFHMWIHVFWRMLKIAFCSARKWPVERKNAYYRVLMLDIGSTNSASWILVNSIYKTVPLLVPAILGNK